MYIKVCWYIALWSFCICSISSGFLCYHLYQIYYGCTTNEMFKWSYVKKYYGKLTAAHQRYLDREKSKTDHGEAVNTTVDDGMIVDNREDVDGDSEINPSESRQRNSDQISTIMSKTDDMSVGCIPGAPTTIPSLNKDPKQSEIPLESEDSNGMKSDRKKKKNKKSKKTAGSLPNNKEVSGPEVEEVDANADVPEFLKEPPGPYPNNIYDQGFFTNLYYFIFPKSMARLAAVQNKLKIQ